MVVVSITIRISDLNPHLWLKFFLTLVRYQIFYITLHYISLTMCYLWI